MLAMGIWVRRRPHGAWGSSFPKRLFMPLIMLHSPSVKIRAGSVELAPCQLIGVRGKTSDEGFMGARRSSETGSARWFLLPTYTWEPLLLTLVVQVSARIDELHASLVSRRKMCNSNKGTGGMESSVVLFKSGIHLFACTHPSVSNAFLWNDWLDCGPWLRTRISSSSVLKTRLVNGSVSVCKHLSTALR